MKLIVLEIMLSIFYNLFQLVFGLIDSILSIQKPMVKGCIALKIPLQQMSLLLPLSFSSRMKNLLSLSSSTVMYALLSLLLTLCWNSKSIRTLAQMELTRLQLRNGSLLLFSVNCSLLLTVHTLTPT